MIQEDLKMLNGANLAYIGDAYFELAIREYLLKKGITNQNKLHKLAVNYVSAKSHSKIFDKIESKLTEEELQIYKRGRNHNYHVSRKNLNLDDYLKSSGFEALIGYLYLLKKERLKEIVDLSIKAVEEENE